MELLLWICFFLYWAVSIAVSRRALRDPDSTHAVREAQIVFLTMLLLVVTGRYWIPKFGLRESPLFGAVSLILLQTLAITLLLMHGFKGGFIVFGVPLLVLTRRPQDVARFVERTWDRMRGKDRRLLLVAEVLCVAMWVIIGIVLIVALLWIAWTARRGPP